MFQNILNFYIYFKTCISSSIACYLNFKPFKNISKIIQSSKISISGLYGRRIYFRLDRSTVRSTGPCGLGRACLCTSAGRPGQSTDRPCGRPTGRPTARPLVSGFVGRLARSTDSSKFFFCLACGRSDQSTKVNDSFAMWPAGRPTAVKKAQRLFIWI